MKHFYLAFLFVIAASMATFGQQFLTQVNGLNAYVHLPDDYNQTSKNYPVIIFFPGLGDIGTDASRLLSYGPSKFINDGHNMQFTVNGVVEKPIVISIQPKDAYPQPGFVDGIFNTVMATWRIDPNKFHVTGLSMGGFCANNYVTAGVASYTSRITSIVSMSAVVPNYPISNFANYAQASGKWWGITGTQDERGITTIFNTMNASVAGSAKRTYFTEGGGGHCCWNTFYDPNWRENGVSIYEWMLAQQKGSVAPQVPDPIVPIPATPGPLKYRYYTYSGTWYSMPNLHSLTPASSGTMANISLANKTQDDRFAYLWEGFINIPVSGTYTFRTRSDDGSQFWIGSLPAPLINNDGLHGVQDKDGSITLNAGVYPVAILYYDQIYDETMNLLWNTPQTSGSFQPVPNTAFVTAPNPTSTVSGLKYRYFTFSGTWYTMPNLHGLTPVATGTVANVNLDNRTQNDRFAYIWDGNITIPVTGEYTFRTTSDDGSQFWIGSLPAPLINNDGLHAPLAKEGTLTLTAGTYPIAFLYFEQDGGETMNVSWRTPQTGGNFVAIPNSAFSIPAASLTSTTTAPASAGMDESIQEYNKSKAQRVVAETDIASASIAKIVPENIVQDKLVAFPNPAIEHISLRLTHATKGALQVKVFNTLGVAVKSIQYTKDNIFWQEQVSVSDLSAGYYIIEVKGNGLNYKTSFIKK